MTIAEPEIEPEVRASAADRLTFFVDAVLAIALTLLALDLPVPSGTSNHALLSSALDHRQEYLAFVISFLVIGRQWRSHHLIFRYVTAVDGPVIRLTLGWLFLQVATPFATRVITGDGGFQVRFGFYAVVQAVAFLLFTLMVLVIRREGAYRPSTPPRLFTETLIKTGMVTVGFLVSIPVSFVTSWSYLVWVAVPVLTSAVLRARTIRR